MGDEGSLVSLRGLPNGEFAARSNKSNLWQMIRVQVSMGTSNPTMNKAINNITFAKAFDDGMSEFVFCNRFNIG